MFVWYVYVSKTFQKVCLCESYNVQNFWFTLLNILYIIEDINFKKKIAGQMNLESPPLLPPHPTTEFLQLTYFRV